MLETIWHADIEWQGRRWCMGGGKGSSPPPPPDPKETAAAQAAANREAAIATQELGMINQYTPFGNLEYTQRGTSPTGNPLYSATQTLTPEQQAILDQQTAVQQQYGETAGRQLGAVSELLSQPLDYSALGAAPEISEDVRLAQRDRLLQRMAPDQERDLARLESRLAAQGIGIGSEAYNEEMRRYQRGLNDARLSADIQAGNEMARMYGLESTARDRAINEMIQQRTQPLNELAAMMTGVQVQQPSYISTPAAQVNPTDIIGATYGSANIASQNWAAEQQRRAAEMQALADAGASLGTMAMYKWSDRRLKRNIRRIGEWRGHALYAYEYAWGEPSVGVMAQEVARTRPGAVRAINGYLAVNYGAL